MRDLGADLVLHICHLAVGIEISGRLCRPAGHRHRQELREDPHNTEIVVCEPWPQDEYLTRVPGCLARLRTFDPEWQAEVLGAEEGDRIVVLDLDLVITGSLDGLFDRDEPFVILQGVHTANPTPYNGSVWMLQAGYRPDVWEDFSLEAAQDICVYMYPDDQMWMSPQDPGRRGVRAEGRRLRVHETRLAERHGPAEGRAHRGVSRPAAIPASSSIFRG